MIRRSLALAKKELRQLFASPIAYVVLTIYVALTGIYFFQHLVSYNQLLFVYQSEGLTGGGFDQGTVPSQINVLNEVFVPSADDFGLFLLVVLPLVTMRVFAEERANGTDELLLTSGLRPWEIALAKHGVTYLFVLLLLAASAIYPAVVVARAGLGFEHLVRAVRRPALLRLRDRVDRARLLVVHVEPDRGRGARLRDPVRAARLRLALEHGLRGRGVACCARSRCSPTTASFPRGVIELRHVIYFAGIAVPGLARCRSRRSSSGGRARWRSCPPPAW